MNDRDLDASAAELERALARGDRAEIKRIVGELRAAGVSIEVGEARIPGPEEIADAYQRARAQRAWARMLVDAGDHGEALASLNEAEAELAQLEHRWPSACLDGLAERWTAQLLRGIGKLRLELRVHGLTGAGLRECWHALAIAALIVRARIIARLFRILGR